MGLSEEDRILEKKLHELTV